MSPLAGLTNLTTLWLGSNVIGDISPLAGLTSLTELGLWSNEIRDVSPLAELGNLTKLDLGFNSISDIAPLAELANLTWLNLRGNCLERDSLEVHVPALQSRGVEVLFDTACTSMSTIGLHGRRGGR